MRTLLLIIALSAPALSSLGCVATSEYDRVRNQLVATHEENERLREENDALRKDLVRSTTKLEMIDSIIHDGTVDVTTIKPKSPDAR